MGNEVSISAAPLTTLCDQIGVAKEALVEAEGINELAHTFEVSGQAASGLRLEELRAFVDEYGDAGSLEVQFGGLTELTIRGAVDEQALNEFVARAARQGPYDVVIRIKKRDLLPSIVGPSPARTVRAVMFSQTLAKFLRRGLREFEREVWPMAPDPLVLLAFDAEIQLTGPHLTILGGDALAEAQAFANLPKPDLGFDSIAAARDRLIGWDTAWVRGLTPWHFELTGNGDDPALVGLLNAQLVKLAILFTCDRARVPNAPMASTIIAEFRGREHVAFVPIEERSGVALTTKEAAAIIRLVNFCYERRGEQDDPDWVADRLPFVQIRVAQTLEPHPAAARLTAYVSAVPFLVEGILWSWKAWIAGKISEYLDRVQQLEILVADTVAKYASRSQDLVKALRETMLAAIGVLVGTFIAAAFKDPFNATLFRIGVLSYAGYVLLFPGAFGLTAAELDLRRARRQFNERCTSFQEILLPEKVSTIVGNKVKDAQTSVHRWMVTVGLCYVITFVAAIIAAARVPAAITSS